MRRKPTLIIALTLVWAVAASGLAQDTTTPPADKPAAEAADTLGPAQLRAEMHRTMAALLEARAAPEPDQEKIEELGRQLVALRAKIRAHGPGAFGMGQCPWGGPMLGYGQGRGGMGNRYGRGGPGYGRGPAAGRGPALGPAWGGPGWGGPARGPGRGNAGMGYGRGRGGGFGPGYGAGPGRGYGYGPNAGRGYGRRWGFVDSDGDGICDNAQNAANVKVAPPQP